MSIDENGQECAGSGEEGKGKGLFGGEVGEIKKEIEGKEGEKEWVREKDARELFNFYAKGGSKKKV